MVEVACSAIVDPEVVCTGTELLAVASLAVASEDPELICANINPEKTINANTAIKNDLIFRLGSPTKF